MLKEAVVIEQRTF